ncbi:DUF1302 domain-containing protein [Aquabacterium sp. OR-4]|uniref:DUF1302 domain-containing protein n=1 Tax=Aquabacterium sp. OR-4 TaxID=2978127 RepID=UPI0028CA8E49|nr:DUF1302 family protein [Aquabacterium sp. OR-4]MDT7838986.1 DUF1302 family protein [Aquabacterium sp. OR-4]
MHEFGRRAPAARSAQPVALAAALVAAAAAMPAQAVDLNPGGDWQVRWDNTVRLSSALRVKGADLAAASPNTDDGNRNFGKGLVSARADLLSEFDAQRGGFGLRLSGAAWYDGVYNRSNDHDSPLSASRSSGPGNSFSAGTRELAGRKAELLDAFVFGRHDFGGPVLSARLGRHSLIWGTSLFFGMNGMAKGMAPIDVYKLSLPGTQAKETTMPVPQLSATLQLGADTSLEGYLQFGYKPTRLHPAGSYLSSTDMLGDGAERMFIGNATANRCGSSTVPVSQRFNNCYLNFLGLDEGAKARNLGLALNTRIERLDADLGLYAVRYRDTSTLIQTNTGGGSYRLIVPADPIEAVGLSLARQIGEANVGLELSVREDQPLIAKEGVVTAADPSYAKGRTAHLNLSWTLLLPKAGFWEGASLLGELAANTVLDIDPVKTSVAGRLPLGTEKLNRERHRHASGLRVIFTPTWYQVLPGLDLSAPVNLGWSLRGTSMIDNSFPFSGSPDHAGELILGLTGVYLSRWNANLSYIHYIGKAATQPVFDRNYLRLSLQATF